MPSALTIVTDDLFKHKTTQQANDTAQLLPAHVSTHFSNRSHLDALSYLAGKQIQSLHDIRTAKNYLGRTPRPYIPNMVYLRAAVIRCRSEQLDHALLLPEC